MAIKEGQLGNFWRKQNDYEQALKHYSEACVIFKDLGEQAGLATALHQIGIAHRQANQFKKAEFALRQSLAIRARQNNLAEQAGTHDELGNLYAKMELLEEAVPFHLKAANIYTQLNDRGNEGAVRSNLAASLIRLQRYEKARPELQRAIVCRESLGHAAEPWKTWDIKSNLERAAGDAETAAEARQRAIQTYMAYRLTNAVSQHKAQFLIDKVARAVQSGQKEAIEKELSHMARQNLVPESRIFLTKLQTILAGKYAPDLIHDPALPYTSVVELQLLLKKITV